MSSQFEVQSEVFFFGPLGFGSVIERFDFVRCINGVTTIVIRPHVECFISLGPVGMHA